MSRSERKNWVCIVTAMLNLGTLGLLTFAALLKALEAAMW